MYLYWSKITILSDYLSEILYTLKNYIFPGFFYMSNNSINFTFACMISTIVNILRR